MNILAKEWVMLNTTSVSKEKVFFFQLKNPTATNNVHFIQPCLGFKIKSIYHIFRKRSLK